MYAHRTPSEPTFSRSGVTGYKFPTQNLTDKTQFLIIETAQGHNTTIIEKECVFSYYILEIEGHFIIDNNKQACKTGNLVVIPANTPFRYQGKLKMLLNVTPPFYPEQEVVVNDI
jgi:mannose-6-phosphate isomerase-like protein (cupin superfamily)